MNTKTKEAVSAAIEAELTFDKHAYTEHTKKAKTTLFSKQFSVENFL